jgi:plasmid stabilization system protein ParE
MKKKKEVKILPIAEQDLSELIEFIAFDKPAAAESLLSRIEKNMASLAENPLIG